MEEGFLFSGGVVGIDPSLTGTGFARLDEKGALSVLDTFGTQANYGVMPLRWLHIVKSIRKHVTPNDLVFIEDYAYGKATGGPKKGKSDSSIVTLAELGGVIKLAIYNITKRYPLMVASTTLKAYLGDGHLKKDMISKEVYKKLKVDCATHDEYVALALADLGWIASGRTPRREKVTAQEVKACRTLRTKVRDNPALYLGSPPSKNCQMKLIGINS